MALKRNEAGCAAPELGGGAADAAPSGYLAYHACSENRSALIQPPLDDAELLLKKNLSRQPSDFWAGLRQQARTQLLADARHYTAAYRDVPGGSARPAAQSGEKGDDCTHGLGPIVMAGHQPTLFHPGVWFKNFALQGIASSVGAHAINLVIDNDVAAGRSIRVPVRDSVGRVYFKSVAYDAGGAGVPFEQAKIRDLRQFDRFDQDVRQTISPLVSDPCVSELWPHARAAIRRCEIAGCALAQARHRLEADLGWQTLEIPLGVAVRGVPFARFVMEVIDDAERFHQVYNDAADHYRAWHGIRSTAHPVPNLGRDGEWLELPLWVYGNDHPVRRAIWVRRREGQIELSDRASDLAGSGPAGNSPPRHSVVLPADDRDAAAEILAEAASPEWKLRPRALMTTMFARLLLSDLFLHGIGGGKYDQLADRIICRFFQLTLPALQVVSATLRLPGQDRDPNRPDRIQALQNRIRETRYHGENWVDATGAANQRLIERKQELLEHMPPRGDRGDWHREITRVNGTLADELRSQRQEMQAELQRLRLESKEEQILASRELSFCLFPLPELVGAFEQMLR
ncbi:hypothetical protein [Allorhodopirellula solitaria]|uniref:Uncharacterized protein n=1 Tax=Allorhodopirellula solitaria TaxID=2527987 RepID=A0A5C5XQ39_9BACT|nr:hypothetical protein [Allorhodopirellula solitaria]TWT64758.1 hypothetical protein CA85_35430 [Allorhodopirellula solitaria]